MTLRSCSIAPYRVSTHEPISRKKASARKECTAHKQALVRVRDDSGYAELIKAIGEKGARPPDCQPIAPLPRQLHGSSAPHGRTPPVDFVQCLQPHSDEERQQGANVAWLASERC
eukprot:TRINITY_DN8817_c0_g1_i3.p3 TRINITY_DN8817_c0_g1~~TRINITY_DN8817_c0_g1_i3.p3  ORF type:complete len:115 (-),score=2.26 TRINITY_DN8817_c0_g1_i3:1457-1801(-)